MKIVLKQLDIINFKGIKKLSISFDENETNILARNGVGKTTIVDAYKWLLTGKDSYERKDFEIKPTDKDGNVIHRLENEVTATISVDGRDTKLTRVNREKWVTKRGSSEDEYTGNETKFFIDEVPLSQKDYQAKVGAIISDDMLKLLTDTNYFNLQLGWQERRNVLKKMAGDVTNDMVLDKFSEKQEPKYITLIKALIDSGKSFKERIDELRNKRKIAKDEKELIPSRIDEVSRQMPVPLPFGRIKTDLEKAEKELVALDEQINDRNKAAEAVQSGLTAKREELFKLKNQLLDIERKHREAHDNEIRQNNESTSKLQNELTELKTKKQHAEVAAQGLETRLENSHKAIALCNEAIERKSSQKATLLEQWKAENAKQLLIDTEECLCPICKQQLPQAQLEEKQTDLLNNFNKAKQNKLSDLEANANRLNEEIKIEQNNIQSYITAQSGFESEKDNYIKNIIPDLVAKISELEAALNAESNTPKETVITVPERIAADADYSALHVRSEGLQAEINTYQPVDVSDIVAKKTALQSTVDAYKSDLLKEQLIKNSNERIEELKGQEQSLAQAIADYEAEEFAIAQFQKAEMEYVQERVNSLFSLVKFRMFKTQINGGEEPCCDCLVDGVEFEKNLNQAKKVNAGLDIINALSNYYNISTPIFIDARESVTDTIPVNSQLINLIVSKAHNELTVLRQHELQEA